MDASTRDDNDRGETKKERLDRNLEQLLGELRVALPGVQVLFAFLLVVPFNQRFADITSFQQTVYFATLLCATAACACLIAPTAHHRLRFRSGVKEELLRVANAFTLVGLVLLAFAISAATYVITDLIYPGTLPRVVAGVLAGAFVVVWFVVPLFYGRERTPEPRSRGGRD
jgi:hypothetical protein